MFKEDTVLILGAGASVDFKYPTGDELVEKIEKDANEVGQVELSRDLKQFKPFSIDLFLSLYPRYEEMGKEAIAREILKCENEDKLFNNKNNWYRFLIDAIITGCKESEDINGNKLTIITFNYDLSLEYYIYKVLKGIDFFNFKIGEAKNHIPISAVNDFLKKLDIIHIYGQVGCYNWHSENYNKYYGDLYTKGNIREVLDRHPSEYGNLEKDYQKYSNYIEVIGAEKWRKDSKPYHVQEAIKKLKAAKKVFILGFGFYQENMELLEFEDVFAPVYGKKVFYINHKNQKKIEYRLDNYLKSYIKTKNDKDKKNIPYSTRSNDFFMSEKGIYEALEQDFDLV